MILYAYLIIYVISYGLMSKRNKSFYKTTLKEWRYFTWLLSQPFEFKDVWYKPFTILIGLLFVLLFPTLSIVCPLWDEIVPPEYLILPYAVHMDGYPYTKTKNMQNKIYWEHLFRKHGIHTPTIFCTSPSSCKNTPVDIPLLSKPIYGTQGAGIQENTSVDDYMRLTEEYMLQEQLTDCYAPESKRHFRIVTCFDGTVFYTKEFKHPRKRFEGTICSSFKCSKTLSAKEKRDLRSIKTQLKTLHISEFQCVPFIGWDVMLTCKGAFVLEGNLGATITVPYYKKKYIRYMRSLFSLM